MDTSGDNEARRGVGGRPSEAPGAAAGAEDETVAISPHMLQAWKEGQELCHAFMEDTDDLLTRLDPEGRLTYVNRAAERYFGLSAPDCIGRSALEFVHPDDRARTERELKACFAGQEPSCSFSNRQVSRTGEVRDVLWNTRIQRGADGRVSALTSIARDVTARKHAAEVHDRFQQALLSLAKQKAFSGGDLSAALKAITETSAHALGVERVGVWLYRDNYARIQCVNLYHRSTNRHEAGAELMASSAPTYFKALGEDRVIAEADAPAGHRTCELAGYLRENGIGAMLDAPVHSDGAIAGIICHEHVGGRRDWSHEEQAFAASIGDMVTIVVEQSELKRVELEMLRQSIELEKAKELARLQTEFINTVAHELRTPLTSVIGLAELLEEGVGGALTAPQREQVAAISSNLSRLTRLVNDLMDMARMQVGAFRLECQEVDLVALIAANVESQRPQADAGGVELAFERPASPPTLVADPLRLDQVVANLLSNALKFTPKGGRIEVRLRDVGDHWRVEVADNGVSIAPEDIPRLFQRFGQLEAGQDKGGLGLGLSISKGLVEAHGGAIGVESAPGQGATFWFTLPRAANGAGPA